MMWPNVIQKKKALKGSFRHLKKSTLKTFVMKTLYLGFLFVSLRDFSFNFTN